MNNDLTVLALMLSGLFLEAVGAWHFLPGLFEGLTEWTRREALLLAVPMAVSSAVLIFFTYLLVKRIRLRML
ncbi:MAG: hypothetical protein DWQ47_00425 [Acidobacteria bacterium]|nr:MAG: hypothetical protein DWQ32_10885 [Acidobacteriota bacterium]REK03975.1 MAG: hypothetical protein DWQ38_00410 [Acidobacteriota bacterium]REK15137.1 MAG: hypothetical protein DWQ43_16575 [Acidobacteriota bacterium]REK46227.1 MAG: hypothetical protein DWQ47_00425 [Acidobacteriota bacterium]